MVSETWRIYKDRHEDYLKRALQETPIASEHLRTAIQYSVFSGGKRLRPFLVYCTGALINAPVAALDCIAAAVELIHCYSLIHDDLPAMDDDDFRRGKPSCHRAFDEATAILAGDALQGMAVQLLVDKISLPAALILPIVRELLRASGGQGMVSGQCLDLTELMNHSLTEERLLQIHQLKTGCLFQACINMPLLTAKCHLSEQLALQQFAEHFGVLFQICDDYLDAYSLDHSGKKRSSDAVNMKFTFARLYTKEALKERIKNEAAAARKTLLPFAERATEFHALLDSCISKINHNCAAEILTNL